MKFQFMNNIDTLIESLNKEQKDAVLSTEGPNLIVAGAGSGKTKVLTTRLIHIISKKKRFQIKYYVSLLLIKQLKKCKTEFCNILKVVQIQYLG